MNYLKITLLPLCLLFILSLLACRETTQAVKEKPTGTEATEIMVEAESFTGSSGTFTTEDCAEGGKQVLSPQKEGWLAFSVEVPVAGRYQIQIRALASDSVTFWVEDHVDNTDGRTFNVSSNVVLAPLAKAGYQTLTKDGTPLNQGTHQMKLHVGQGIAAVNWVKFTLMREHQLTPKSLTQNHEGENWELVWSDEFEQDGLPDSTKWTYDIGNWGWGNYEPQYYTEGRKENARVENGNLIIEAIRNDMGQPWTSARITTRGKVSFLYGKIEFRAKVPAERGNWAAGWTLGDDYRDERSWPYCGEIDIIESVGYEMDDKTGNGVAHATCHTRAHYFKAESHITGTIEVENMNNAFHTYAVEWTPEGILAFVDDKHYYTYDKTNGELEWPFGKPQNIILNLAMGGGWGGLKGIDDNISSQQFIVDYVRVFEKR